MSNEEFDLLDELYFVTPFTDLTQQLDWPEEKVERVLRQLFERGWVRIFSTPDNPYDVEELEQVTTWNSLYYLASKEGLKAHNS